MRIQPKGKEAGDMFYLVLLYVAIYLISTNLNKNL